jgi:excisionase family DNA binding protein
MAQAHSTLPERRRPATRLLGLLQASEYTGISIWTLRDLIATGELPAVRPPNLRRVWIDRDELDAAIDRWKERAR